MKQRNVQKKKPTKRAAGVKPQRFAGPTKALAAAYSSNIVRGGPQFSFGANGSLTVSHSECFANHNTPSDTFYVVGYNVNPGMSNIFPWLSAVASRFETYHFRKLEFTFHTRCASTNAGSLLACFDFDCLDPPPGSLLEALSYQDKTCEAPWVDQRMVVKLQSDHLPARFTRCGAPLGNLYDIKTYDVGCFYLGGEGMGTHTTMGIWEVSYVVDLFTPQMESPVGGKFTAITGLDGSHMFGTDPTPQSDHVRLPFHIDSSNVAKFLENFEGLLNATTVGTALLDNLSLGVGGPATVTKLSSLINGASTTGQSLFAIRAQPGATLTPACTASTITAQSWEVAKADYDQCV